MKHMIKTKNIKVYIATKPKAIAHKITATDISGNFHIDGTSS